MSVIHDCLEGDRIYIIEEFIVEFVSDNTGNLDLESSIVLEIGDSVVYQDWFIEEIGNNLYMMVRFKAKDDLVFAVKETFFVTEDTWEALERYFSQDK